MARALAGGAARVPSLRLQSLGFIVAGSLAVCVACLLVGGHLVERYSGDVAASRARVDHSHEVRSNVASLQIALLRMQLAARNYVVTGGAFYRDSVYQLRDNVGTDLARLRSLVSDNPSQTQRVDALKLLLDAQLARLQALLAVGPDVARRQEALALIRLDAAGEDERSRHLLMLDWDERRLLTERNFASEEMLGRTHWLLRALVLVACLAGSAAVLLCLLRLRSNARRYRELAHAQEGAQGLIVALRRSESRLTAILDHAHDGIVLASGDGVIRLANAACQAIFGMEPDDLAGRPITTLLPNARGDKPLAGTMAARRGDGSEFPVELSNGTMQLDDEQAFVFIIRDVTERQRLDRLKSEFVSTVSHELRTPLTSIRGSLGLIVAGTAGALPEPMMRLLKIAHANCERLVALINDILEIERMEAGRALFQFADIDLAELAREAVDSTLPFAAQHQASIAIAAAPAEPVFVRADRNRIMQVLANLLSNAAKFSPPSGTVEISLVVAGGDAMIIVSDRGGGVPEEFRPRLFQKFAQADSSDVKRAGGTGLGLSICKTIIERHGGSIGFREREGGGSGFWFRLPRIERPAATVPSEPVEAHGRRLLICEDDADTAHLLAILVGRDGWTSEIALSAEAALECLACDTFDAMTLDLMLPGMSGVSLIRAVRANPATAALPVIVVTAYAAEGREQLRGDAVGLLDWLAKPIEEDRLRAALQAALAPLTGQPPRVLHVEDDDDLATVLAAIMADRAEMRRASTLAEARQALATEAFALVILDIKLPDGSGFELLEPIRACEPRPSVMLLSAQEDFHCDPAEIAASMVKGSVPHDQLRAAIAALLDRHGRTKAAMGEVCA